MGRLHARTLTRLGADGGECRLVGIADHHPDRAASLARELGVEIATTGIDTTWEELLEQVDPDAAIVAVPTAAHAELAEGLLARGLDVLVEKPLAADVSEGERLVELAQRHRRILQVGHVEWYNAAWREAAGRVGRLRRIEVERTSPVGERGLDIDVVQDLMLHDLDWVTRWVGDEVVELTARDSRRTGDRLDAVEAQLRFRSGVRARLRASRLGPAGRRSARFEGTAGTATADLIARTVDASCAAGEDVCAALGPDPLEAQWRDFEAAVRGREPPINDAVVGLAALRLVARVQQAAAADSGEARRDDDSRLGG
jgi:predicted dehydrogenase